MNNNIIVSKAILPYL